jgi:Trk-type K+ transport system membrane component
MSLCCRSIDWFFFLVLDLSNPSVTAIPAGVRVIDGLLQATAVRAAGFGVVTLADLAPAVKVLYVVMMYISVYPIAMSVRSTNVYEERSLGLFNPHDHDQDDSEDTFVPSGDRMTVWSRYLAMHARQQLAFGKNNPCHESWSCMLMMLSDMWWLALSLFLICIIEVRSIGCFLQMKD